MRAQDVRSDRPDDDDDYDDDDDETKAYREKDIKKTCARDRHDGTKEIKVSRSDMVMRVGHCDHWKDPEKKQKKKKRKTKN